MLIYCKVLLPFGVKFISFRLKTYFYILYIYFHYLRYDDDAAEYENAPEPNEINNEDQMISSVKPVEMLDHTEPVKDSTDNSTEEQTESNEAVTASAENMTVNAILKYLQDLQGKYSFHFSAESLQLNPT